jgi:hypothetical protein
MASNVPRTKEDHTDVPLPTSFTDAQRGNPPVSTKGLRVSTVTSKLWRSEGHPINRKTGKRMSGGPFHVTHTEEFSRPSHVFEMCRTSVGIDNFYTGPLNGSLVTTTALNSLWPGDSPSDWNESSMKTDGTTAISQCAPTNPTAQLATTLAESVKEGIPSLPGIQSWKKRTEAAKAAGSEYLNYQFGWHPLVSEVGDVVHAARNHRDIMQNYRHNEGRDIHRRFDFPVETKVLGSETLTPGYFGTTNVNNFAGYIAGEGVPAVRVSSVTTERRRWFEGCFTYGGPSGTDYFRRAIGFGSEADAVYGLALTPNVLWELTPWSWAVDWFTNTGDVINNVTNFALAGLVMRYGYIMEENTRTYQTEYSNQVVRRRTSALGKTPRTYGPLPLESTVTGKRVVSRSRVAASPFGFGVGWEGLSPTQLAITAAIGITRLL